MGNNRFEEYYDVEVKRQYKKIDVLVLYKDNQGQEYALIIEDKTNTSEHSNQIERYKAVIKEDFKNAIINVAYVKTGIIYDVDFRVIVKAFVVELIDILNVIKKYASEESSEILLDYYNCILAINEERENIINLINNGQYSKALEHEYGQYIFLDKVFNNRTKGTKLGKYYIDAENNPEVYIDEIYAGSNLDGTPWTQYCFWGKEYPEQIKNSNEIEYHYLFWRIDHQWEKVGDDQYVPKYYIALRHYDQNAHSKDERLNERKREVYRKFREKADEYTLNNTDIFEQIGVRENYKESDLLFIPVNNILNMNFEDVKQLLLDITKSMKEVIK